MERNRVERANEKEKKNTERVARETRTEVRLRAERAHRGSWQTGRGIRTKGSISILRATRSRAESSIA